jgi:hypothetical protein
MAALEEYVKSASMTAGMCAGEVDALRVRTAALEEVVANLTKLVEKFGGAVKDLSKLTPGGDSVTGIDEVEFFDTDGFAPCQVKDDEVARNPDEAGLSPAQKAQNSLPPNAMLKLSSDGLRPADASKLLAESRTFTRTTGKRVFDLGKYIDAGAQEVLRHIAEGEGILPVGAVSTAAWENILGVYVGLAGSTADRALRDVEAFHILAPGSALTVRLVLASVSAMFGRFEAALRTINDEARYDKATRGKVVHAILRSLPQPLADHVKVKEGINGVYGVRPSITFKGLLNSVKASAEAIMASSDLAAHAALNVTRKDVEAKGDKPKAGAEDKSVEIKRAPPYVKCAHCGGKHASEACRQARGQASAAEPRVGAGAGAGAAKSEDAAADSMASLTAARRTAGECLNCGKTGHQVKQCAELCSWEKNNGKCTRRDCPLKHAKRSK